MATNYSRGQMTAQVSIDPNAKSGFDLGFHNYGTGKIGRIIPTRAQKVHPNDNINTTSIAALQFEPLAVPIMARMEEKQEHFYVPYNVVWKDWDDFISNGEDNNFNGVAPSTTLADIMNVITAEYLASLMELKLIGSSDYHSFMGMSTLVRNFTIDYTNSTGYGVLSDVIANIRAEFDSIGELFMAKDIFKYVDECILNLTNLCKGVNYSDYKSMFLMCEGGTAYKLYDEMVSKGLITSKYITNMKDWYRSLGNAERNYTSVIPTDEAVIFAKCLYDFIKPLVGLGSNYDYLNIGRITLEEFLFAICYNLQTDVFIDSGGVEDMGDGILKYETQGDVTPWNNEPIVIFNLRANYAVWYHNYRDPILEADAFKPINTSNITNEELFTLLIPRQRCWEKDAFTTALDNPGTGSVGVPVNIQGYTSFYQDFTGKNAQVDSTGRVDMDNIQDNGNAMYEVYIGDTSYRVPTAFLTGMNEKLDRNEVESSGFSLYQLDACQRAQSWLQKMLFFGNRIQDFYYLRFSVRFLDARLRLPELLSSSSNLVSIDTVMNNTNITTEVNGQMFQTIAGDRAGYASARDDGNFKDRYIEEHGVLLSYLTVLPMQTYGYGRSRDYSRLDMFDYAFSEFATLGMDAIYSTELAVSSLRGGMFVNTQLDPHPEIFGYQGRYYDYKAQNDEEHGEMLDSQDMYTFGREFKFGLGGKPRLNYEFVHCFPNLDMFVVNSRLEDYFRYDVFHRNNCERQLPAHSVYIK